jgi:hypothetical protein
VEANVGNLVLSARMQIRELARFEPFGSINQVCRRLQATTGLSYSMLRRFAYEQDSNPRTKTLDQILVALAELKKQAKTK